MSTPNKSNNKILIIIIASVIIAVIIIAAVGYVIGSNYGMNQSPHNKEINITGSYLTETLPVSSNSTIMLNCNFCTITFNLNSSVTIQLNVLGNYNTALVNKGYTNLDVSGSFNTIYVKYTKLLGLSDTGSYNNIYQ